jgi:hypothetical protein
LTDCYSASIVAGMSRNKRGNERRWWSGIGDAVLCDYCDEYHEGYVGCPHYGDFRRTTDVDDEEIERDAFARHDRRLFG